jgi:hypothetical protein
MEKNEPGLRQMSVEDQIDTQLVRELEQSGFFRALQPAK